MGNWLNGSPEFHLELGQAEILAELRDDAAGVPAKDAIRRSLALAWLEQREETFTEAARLDLVMGSSVIDAGTSRGDLLELLPDTAEVSELDLFVVSRVTGKTPDSAVINLPAWSRVELQRAAWRAHNRGEWSQTDYLERLKERGL